MPQQPIDITDLATLAAEFPIRLMQLGFHLMQATDEQGRDRFRFIVPPLCEVPAGPFLMGSDPKTLHETWDEYAEEYDDIYEDECPQHTVTLDTFRIAKYPLTV